MFYRNRSTEQRIGGTKVFWARLKEIMKLLNRAKNMLQMSKGKTKEVTGRVVGNKDLASDGANDQHKEHLKRVGEKVKDAIEEL